MCKVGDRVRRVVCANRVTVGGIEKILPVGAVRTVQGERNGMITVSGFPAPFGSCVSKFELVQEAPTSRANDPATSKGKRKVNKYEEAVLDALGNDSPFGMDKRAYTGKEIAAVTGHPLNCITPRFAPLRRKGLIKQATCPEGGVPLKRDKQIVWVLV